jgi:hypothetical protein
MRKMNTENNSSRFNVLEKRAATVGFLLSGLVIAVVGISYILNSNYPVKILVWVIGIAFVGVGILAIEWPRGFNKLSNGIPTDSLRTFLILAIPIAFILDTQICGLGLEACSTLCHVISYTMIGLGVVTAVRLYQGKSVGGLLVAMVIVGLIPHCMCGAPINTIWQSLLGGYAPTCQVIPLATTLFSISALKGARTKWSVLMVIVLLIVTVFIVVGNPLWGFPWKGCIG